MKTFLKPLTTEEETFYLRKCRQGDKAARDVLIERNLRLVAHIVKKYQGVDEDLDDLISIGTIGLIKAVSTYDMTKGSRLATYAARCIDNELLMMLRSRKKFSREVSLYEPIGTDKEGNEIHLLDIVEGKDYVTLVTCTPYAVNTHRLLVRGHRVPYTGEEKAKTVSQVRPAAMAQRVVDVWPWFLFMMAGVAVTEGVIILLILIKRHHDKKKKG